MGEFTSTIPGVDGALLVEKSSDRISFFCWEPQKRTGYRNAYQGPRGVFCFIFLQLFHFA